MVPTPGAAAAEPSPLCGLCNENCLTNWKKKKKNKVFIFYSRCFSLFSDIPAGSGASLVTPGVGGRSPGSAAPRHPHPTANICCLIEKNNSLGPKGRPAPARDLSSQGEALAPSCSAKGTANISGHGESALERASLVLKGQRPPHPLPYNPLPKARAPPRLSQHGGDAATTPSQSELGDNGRSFHLNSRRREIPAGNSSATTKEGTSSPRPASTAPAERETTNSGETRDTRKRLRLRGALNKSACSQGRGEPGSPLNNPNREEPDEGSGTARGAPAPAALTPVILSQRDKTQWLERCCDCGKGWKFWGGTGTSFVFLFSPREGNSVTSTGIFLLLLFLLLGETTVTLVLVSVFSSSTQICFVSIFFCVFALSLPSSRFPSCKALEPSLRVPVSQSLPFPQHFSPIPFPTSAANTVWRLRGHFSLLAKKPKTKPKSTGA